MRIEPFSDWFKRHYRLNYYEFQVALENRNWMRELMNNPSRGAIMRKLRKRASLSNHKYRSKSRLRRFKGVL